MGRSKKDPYPTHRGNFCRPERGVGIVLNLYRMSGEGEGWYCQFPPWEVWIFSGTTRKMKCVSRTTLFLDEKHTLLKKCLWEMQVGKGRMQYIHDTINGKIKVSQGVEYINYGHNYTVTIKNALSIQT